MREPTRLPDCRLGVMRENLNAPLGHFAGLDARDGEFGDVGPRFCLDRPLHMREWSDTKAGRLKPAMCGGRISDGKGREMNTSITRHCTLKLAAERGIRGLVENFDIAAP